MITQKGPVFEVANMIRNDLGFLAVDVLGIYDVVVEIISDDIKGLQDKIKKIEKQPWLASVTPYFAVEETTTKPTGLPFAYVLIETTPDKIEDLRDYISKNVQGAQKVDIVWGPFKIIVEVCVDSLDEFLSSLNSIYGTEGLLKTVSLITFPTKRASA